MYTENHVVPLFLKACPGWKTELEEARAGWERERPGRLYLEMEVFARYIVNTYKSGFTEEFPKIFNTLELLVQEGNEKAKELIAVGLMEGIQSISSQEELNSDVFRKWLKEESLKAWNDIARLWHGEKSVTEREN